LRDKEYGVIMPSLNRIKKVISIFLTFLVFAGCSKKNNEVVNSVSDEFIINPIIIDDLTFNLADDNTIKWSFLVNDYIENFLEFSPEILENKSEIEHVICQIQSVPESDTIYQELGWTKAIQIKIKIRNETTLPIDWNIAGAELFYYLGSGRIPGCIIQTKQEHLFSGCIDESINIFTDNSFAGIDEIKPYTFKKQIPQIKSKEFRQLFQEHFYKFSGRRLDDWADNEVLKIEDILFLKLMFVGDDDNVLIINIRYDDTTKKLFYKDDFHIALCAMISIVEPYLEKNQIEQFATTLENSKSYLEKYQEYPVTQGYWMPSGNKYYAKLMNNSFSVEVIFEIGE
jgi:hypothetical protein